MSLCTFASELSFVYTSEAWVPICPGQILVCQLVVPSAAPTEHPFSAILTMLIDQCASFLPASSRSPIDLNLLPNRYEGYLAEVNPRPNQYRETDRKRRPATPLRRNRRTDTPAQLRASSPPHFTPLHAYPTSCGRKRSRRHTFLLDEPRSSVGPHTIIASMLRGRVWL